MKHFGGFALAALVLATPAGAQVQSEIDTFISAVRDRDGAKAMEVLESRGPSVVNARNGKGETPLTIAVGNRDSMWTRFLLQKGANPDLADRSGDTPLIVAARIGFTDAADWLLDAGAKVDGTNRKGETPLIVAVQQRNVALVRLLLDKGASPTVTDNVVGLSARDYAQRDTRSRELLRLIEQAESKKD